MVHHLFFHLLVNRMYGEKNRRVLVSPRQGRPCWSLDAQEVLLLLFCWTFYFFVCLFIFQRTIKIKHFAQQITKTSGKSLLSLSWCVCGRWVGNAGWVGGKPGSGSQLLSLKWASKQLPWAFTPSSVETRKAVTDLQGFLVAVAQGCQWPQDAYRTSS